MLIRPRTPSCNRSVLASVICFRSQQLGKLADNLVQTDRWAVPLAGLAIIGIILRVLGVKHALWLTVPLLVATAVLVCVVLFLVVWDKLSPKR